MTRKLERTYSFSDREALIAWLKSKDIPAPIYVGDTPQCQWTKEVAGITVHWTEECELTI